MDFDRIYETFIRLPLPFGLDEYDEYMETLRSRVSPLVFDLERKQIIRWYSFLVHSKSNGVPTTDDNLFIHILLELTEKADFNELERILPSYCEMTRKAERLQVINGVDSSLLRGSQIEEAWQVIGRASTWIIGLVNAHTKLPIRQVAQFLHFIEEPLLIPPSRSHNESLHSDR